MEALGFVAFWGFSPSINFFKGTPFSAQSDHELNVLLSECADLRHLLRTLAESIPAEREQPINMYLHERQKENLCRALLFLTLICETQMSERERQETFLDLFGNAMVRDKTAFYLDGIARELIQLVTEDERCRSVLRDLVNLDNLRFKDRDEMEEILVSYQKKVPFDVEKLRDQRLRHHFAERYDFRRNAIDWDYQFAVRDKVI